MLPDFVGVVVLAMVRTAPELKRSQSNQPRINKNNTYILQYKHVRTLNVCVSQCQISELVKF